MLVAQYGAPRSLYSLGLVSELDFFTVPLRALKNLPPECFRCEHCHGTARHSLQQKEVRL